MLGIATSSIRFDMLISVFAARGWQCLLIDNGPPSHLPLPPHTALFLSSKTDYQNALLSVAEAFKADFLLSTASYDDLAVLDAQVGLSLDGKRTRYLGHGLSCVTTCADKAKTKELLQSIGVATPPYRICQHRTELTPACHSVGFPSVIKPLVGWSGHGQSIIGAPSQLTDTALDGVSLPALVESFVDGTEMSIEVYRSDDTLVVFPPIYKGRTSLDGLHALEKLRLFPYPWPAAVAQEAANIGATIAASLSANGWLDIDGILAGDHIAVLEVNSRFSGICRMVDLATGMNPYEMAIRDQFEKTPLAPPSIVCTSIEVPITQDIPDYPDRNPHFTRRSASRHTKGYMTVGASDPNTLIETLTRLKHSMSATSDMDRAIKFLMTLPGWRGNHDSTEGIRFHRNQLHRREQEPKDPGAI